MKLWQVPTDLHALYRYFRRPSSHTSMPDGKPYLHQCRAREALSLARTEIALRAAEEAETIRFEWEYDSDYSPYDMYETKEDADHEAKMINDGRWEALHCSIYVTHFTRLHDCPSCRCEHVEREEEAGSLWGIVIDVDDVYETKRDIERDLFLEARSELERNVA